MATDSGRSTTTVALLVVGVLLALWFVRYVVGVFVRLAQAALVVGLVLVGALVLYRLWAGWTDAGDELDEARPR